MLNSKNKKLIINVSIVSVMILAAFLGTYGIWKNAGWPSNHEGDASAIRIYHLIQAWGHGELFPIWAPEENYGLGSLMPLFYPKLFTYSSAIFFLLIEEMKTALLCTVILWATIGGLGIYCCCREMKLPRLWSILWGFCFIFLNYVQFNLIVRGAMAEYTALCILPYLFWWCMRLLRKKQFSWWILPLEILLFLAHVTIMIFSGIMIFTAFILALTAFPEKRKNYMFRSLVSAFIFATIALPWGLLVNDMKKYIMFAEAYIYPPEWNLLPFSRYFLDMKSSLTPSCDIVLQVDAGILAGWLLCMMVLLIFLIKHYSVLRRQFKRFSLIWYFILASLFFYAILQTAPSKYIYETNEIFKSIQFPWRLQCFVSIISILLSGMTMTMLRGKIPYKYLTLYLCIITFFTLSWCIHREYHRQEYLSPDKLTNFTPGNWLEFAPGFPPGASVNDALRKLMPWVQSYSGQPYSVHEGQPEYLAVEKSADGKFAIVCASSKPFILILPAMWNKLYRIADINNQTLFWQFGRSLDDPRMHILVPPGEHVFFVQHPIWKTALEYYFSTRKQMKQVK